MITLLRHYLRPYRGDELCLACGELPTPPHPCIQVFDPYRQTDDTTPQSTVEPLTADKVDPKEVVLLKRAGIL